MSVQLNSIYLQSCAAGEKDDRSGEFGLKGVFEKKKKKMRAALFLFLHSCLAFEVDERLKMLEGVRFSPEQKHRELLENVIEFGLNQSQYLQEIQERDLWTKGGILIKSSSS